MMLFPVPVERSELSTIHGNKDVKYVYYFLGKMLQIPAFFENVIVRPARSLMPLAAALWREFNAQFFFFKF